MSRKLLVTAAFFLPVIDEYRALLAEHDLEAVPVSVVQALSEDELVPLVADAVAMIVGDDEVSARVIDAAPQLRVIAKWGTGLDAIDRATAAARGIAVVNTPAAFTDPVADTAVGYMLSFCRQLPWLDRDLRAGLWRKRPGFSLAESTVGIVGCGNIGLAVARRVRAFGAAVVGTDALPAATERAAAEGVELVGLDELLARADFVSLHVPHDADTHHLIGAAQLAAMKPTAYLINTSRGRLVDETALVAALERGDIAGAGLDVFEQEPLPEDSGLRRLDNVLLAPHNANASPAAWKRVHESTITQLLDVLAGLR